MHVHKCQFRQLLTCLLGVSVMNISLKMKDMAGNIGSSFRMPTCPLFPKMLLYSSLPGDDKILCSRIARVNVLCLFIGLILA